MDINQVLEVAKETPGIGSVIFEKYRQELINQGLIDKKSVDDVGFPHKQYDVIYADPPWKYDDKAAAGERGAEFKYPCMNVDDICKLPVEQISKDNSVLLMWVTFPQLEEGLKVINSWGFTFKTGAFTWVKTNSKVNDILSKISNLMPTNKGDVLKFITNKLLAIGMGRYTRANAEVCLLATRGSSVPRQSASVRNTQLHTRRSHSEKPNEFNDQIIELFGRETSKIELFARNEYPGFDAWGNEV